MGELFTPGIDATRIAGNLWVGSAPPTGPALRRAGFDTLVLCAQEIQPRSHNFPGVFVIHAPFDDNFGPVTRNEERTIVRAAAEVSRCLRADQSVLVTCAQGRNRSALVAALALHYTTGISPSAAKQLVRERRNKALNCHKCVLQNPAFSEMLA